MSSEPDEEAGATEGQPAAHPTQGSEDRRGQSPPIDAEPKSVAPSDLKAA